ncbi:MAG: magnesium transporter [Bacteroidetes bacterium]|nr:magnesium transporter [Bacteroidota bacterium]
MRSYPAYFLLCLRDGRMRPSRIFEFTNYDMAEDMEPQTDIEVAIHPSDIANEIAGLHDKDKAVAFLKLPAESKSVVFSYLSRPDQDHILKELGTKEISDVLNAMTPDDRTKMLEHFPDHLIKKMILLLSDEERNVAVTLLGYPPQSVGRIMTPHYIQARKEQSVAEVLRHIKTHGKKAETLNTIYVIDEEKKLIDDIQIGVFLMADEQTKVEELMDWNFVCLQSAMDKDEAVAVFEKYDRNALPVVTEKGILVGIVTIDDIVDVIERRSTKNIQKFGGLEALDYPYINTPFFSLIYKRAGWLVVLFIGEMFTATAMGYFDVEISKAVVLALFIPLIISSGGNSGSQAATLIIRAMSLKELTVKDWWYVMRREVLSGLTLGLILGTIGFIRIILWQKLGWYNYTEHYVLVATTIFCSLIGIVMWGTLSGSMIPIVLKKAGIDPATSSAPLVATLVDVTGLIIYFSIAAILLKGTLL